MQEVLKKLEQVQELDVQINTILRKKLEFPERLTGFDKQIKDLTVKFDEKKKIVDELEKNRRQQLGALELNEERIKRSQEKLEQIKTNQEFQALSKEIDALKKNSAVIQEAADKIQTDLDTHKKDLKGFEDSLNEFKAKRDQEASKIAGEEQHFDVDLKRLQTKRGEFTSGIDARYLKTYDRVRMNRTGIGIAFANAGNCKGCNMRIPPQIYNELQRGTEMHLCPSCKRILIYRDSNGSDGSAK